MRAGVAGILLAVLLPCAGAFAKDGKMRVFITDSSSWEVGGAIGASSSAGAGGLSGGARPQTAEIMKTFAERCPSILVTIKRENADYVVVLDHEGGKDLVRRDNKIAVFDREGDMIYSGSTRSLGNAVKDVCNAIARQQPRTPEASSTP
jgi:hypothetical protein